MTSRLAGYAVAGAVALACACNLISGASDLEIGQPPCLGCDGGPERGIDPLDGSLVSDAQKDGDDLTPGGFLDGTFGTDGVAVSPLLSEAYGIAVANSGHVYVVGRSGAHLAVVRFTTDGKPDATFGDEGRLTLAMGSASGGSLTNLIVPDPGAGIAIDSKGRVVVGGTSQKTIVTTTDAGTSTRYERNLYVVRIANGALDGTFDEDGRYLSTTDGEGARAVAIAPDDGIFLVGSGPSGSFTVWRLRADGTPDSLFGSLSGGAPGRVVLPVAGATPAVAAAVDGTSILAAGGSNDAFAVGQLTATGTPATGFGDAGIATANAGPGADRAWAVTAAPDGRIVAGGAMELSGAVRSPVFAVVRLGASGELDRTFGDGGVTSFDFDNGGTWRDVDEKLRGLVIDSRGRIVVAGAVEEKVPMRAAFQRTVLARLSPDGRLDPLFGAGGRMSFTNLPASEMRASALARAGNGSLFVAGNVGSEFFVARIIP